jgi:hypothetical protein
MESYKYILERNIVDGANHLHLMRILVYKGIAAKGEEYYEGEWHDFKGAMTYMYDPYPGDVIHEPEVFEAMKYIDEHE